MLGKCSSQPIGFIFDRIGQHCIPKESEWNTHSHYYYYYYYFFSLMVLGFELVGQALLPLEPLCQPTGRPNPYPSYASKEDRLDGTGTKTDMKTSGTE
jgi:hypothetical protein